jgi:hypothetical protein
MTDLERALAELESLPPQTPMTIVKGCTVRRTLHGQSVMRIHYSAIPERDPDTPVGAAWKKRERATYSSEAAWRKEQEIDYLAQGGESVFGAILGNPEYYQQIVISDPMWHPDPRWDVAFGFDHGKTNATALEKAYITRQVIDKRTGEIISPFDIYLAGEYYSMRRGPSPEEPSGWQNNIDDNVRKMMEMPDIERKRWIVADPSIFPDTVAHAKGDYTSISSEYRDAGFYGMRPYEGVRSDVTFAEWLLSDYWGGIALGKRPRVFIVCRNPSERPQPGLHPYDSPNLLWELKRAKRVEMTARQLMTKNPVDALVDKNNHARDAFKYLLGTVGGATKKPLHEEIEAKLANLTDPTTRAIFARHYFSDAMRKGEIDWTGKPKKSAPVISMRGRRR